jgi:hypothetical protein
MLILDAVDEAQLAAGTPGAFKAFVDDLGDHCPPTATRPPIVIFGREAAAEDLVLLFLERGIDCGWYSVDFFDDLADAHKFIEAYLRQKEDSPGLVSTGPFALARDRLFDILYSVLRPGESKAASDPWRDERVRTFLGYAPVLQSLADYLDTPNPHRLVEAELDILADVLQRAATGHLTRWTFLEEIVLGLLARERDDKVLPQLQRVLATRAQQVGWTDWLALFKAEEQIARVLAYNLSDAKLQEPYVPALPPALRADYEEQLTTLLPSHVLRGLTDGFANVVFRDFVYAWALVKTGSATSHAVEARLALDFLPTPLLGHFLLYQSRRDSGVELDLSLFGYAYDSLLSQARGAGTIRTLVALKSDGRLNCSMGWLDDPRSALEFAIVGDRQSPLRLWRSLQHARIDCDLVTLGSPGRTFRLGPDVELDCNVMEIPASALELVANSEDELVLVDSVAFDSGAHANLRIDEFGEHVLMHLDDARSWPWQKWWFQPIAAPEEKELMEAFLAMSRIFWWFRRRGYRELGRSRRLIDNPAVAGAGLSSEMLEFLVREGVITRNGMYQVDMTRAEELGINYVELRRRSLGAGVRGLLGRFLEETRR